jgi:microsomal dipeptidase-like Zn-dependent dipeptidase
MSVKSRIEYYEFVNRFNKVNSGNKIPVICSHTGANGQDYINQGLTEADTSGKATGSYFNNWSINLSAEEAVLIHDSGGLIGVMIDKGMLGSTETIERISAIPLLGKRKEAYVKLIWDNIFFFIESINESSGWNTIVFGSDYDGLISHIEFYHDASTIKYLSQDMLSYLVEHNYRKDLWFGMSPQQIIQNVFQLNTLAFLEKHWSE